MVIPAITHILAQKKIDLYCIFIKNNVYLKRCRDFILSLAPPAMCLVSGTPALKDGACRDGVISAHLFCRLIPDQGNLRIAIGLALEAK